MTTNPLSIKELKPNSIPNKTSSLEDFNDFKSLLISNSTELIKSLPNSNWKSGKVFNKSTYPTFTYRIRNQLETEGLKWHSRVSYHTLPPTSSSSTSSMDLFDQFKAGLLVNHSLNEKDYIDSCTKAELIESYEEGVLEVWRMSYSLPFPVKNRDFVVLIYTIETTPTPVDSSTPNQRSFQVISIPFDHPLSPPQPGYIRGRYVSVEEVSEDSENKRVVWKMTTASTPAGSIRRKISEMAMDSKISEDVPSFIKWLKSRSKK